MTAGVVRHPSAPPPAGTAEAVGERARQGGALTGTAGRAGQSVPLGDGTPEADRLTGKQAVTEPLRLSPAFAGRPDGDTRAETSGAGRLPVPHATGRRRAVPAASEH